MGIAGSAASAYDAKGAFCISSSWEPQKNTVEVQAAVKGYNLYTSSHVGKWSFGSFV